MKFFRHFLLLPAPLLFPGTAWALRGFPPSFVPLSSLAVFVAVFAVAFLVLLLLRGEKVLHNGEKPPRSPLRRALRLALWISAAWLIFATWITVEIWSERGKHQASREAKSNLGAIRSTEVAYFYEWGVWVGNQPPTPVADRRSNKGKVPWDQATRFSILGFAPEGKVWCSYSLEGPDWPTEAEGFTARAECDGDGDGNIAVYRITNKSSEITYSGAPY